MIGQFEQEDRRLFKEYEIKYLDTKKWKYSNTESDTVLCGGFIKKLMMQARREKLKLFNNVGERTHGYVLSMSRLSEIINENNRCKKRRKRGYCDTEYMIQKGYNAKVRYFYLYIYINNIYNTCDKNNLICD